MNKSVYALYSKSKKTLFLVVPIIIQFVIGALTFGFVLREKSFDYKCDFRNPQQIESVLQGFVIAFIDPFS